MSASIIEWRAALQFCLSVDVNWKYVYLVALYSEIKVMIYMIYQFVLGMYVLFFKTFIIDFGRCII